MADAKPKAIDQPKLVGVLTKAATVLRVLAHSEAPLGPTEIARISGLDRSTVHRILATLSAERIISRTGSNGAYQLGSGLAALGLVALNRLDLRRVARRHFEQLSNRFGETVNLGILDGDAILYVDMIESRHGLRMSASIGTRDEVTTTALGKAILAHLPQEQRAHLLEALRFESRTPRSITSMNQLETDLDETRDRGYSLDIEENEIGACCVGAPIFGFDNEVIGAVSISVPKVRFDDQRRAEMIESLVDTAGLISREMSVT